MNANKILTGTNFRMRYVMHQVCNRKNFLNYIIYLYIYNLSILKIELESHYIKIKHNKF